METVRVRILAKMERARLKEVEPARSKSGEEETHAPTKSAQGSHDRREVMAVASRSGDGRKGLARRNLCGRGAPVHHCAADSNNGGRNVWGLRGPARSGAPMNYADIVATLAMAISALNTFQYFRLSRQAAKAEAPILKGEFVTQDAPEGFVMLRLTLRSRSNEGFTCSRIRIAKPKWARISDHSAALAAGGGRDRLNAPILTAAGIEAVAGESIRPALRVAAAGTTPVHVAGLRVKGSGEEDHCLLILSAPSPSRASMSLESLESLRSVSLTASLTSEASLDSPIRKWMRLPNARMVTITIQI